MSSISVDQDGNPLTRDELIGALFGIINLQSKQVGELNTRVNEMVLELNQSTQRINDWDARLTQIEKGSLSSTSNFNTRVSKLYSRWMLHE